MVVTNVINSKHLSEARARLNGVYECDMNTCESIASKHDYDFTEFTNLVYKNLN